MKFRMKLLMALVTITTVCEGVVLRGQETLGVTLDRWWHWGDISLSLLMGYLFGYPFLILVEQRKAVLRQRRELAVAKQYQGLIRAN